MFFLNPIRTGKSFKYAIKGVIYSFREEQNFRFHVFSAIFVLILMFVLDTSSLEKIFLIFLIGLVIIAELINSIFERIVDIIKPRLHPYAKKIKDMAAAIVLIAAMISFICGLIIFIPKLKVF
jgi:diacylglycerol kinase